MTTIPLSILARIVAVHKAAAVRERSSDVLSGVSLSPSPSTVETFPGITIAATDGKILAEEKYNLDGISETSIDAPCIISGASIALLKDWLKATLKPLKKNADPFIQWEQDSKGATLTLAGSAIGSLRLAFIDGVFPNYESAFAQRIEPDADGCARLPASLGVKAGYLARLDDLWSVGERDGLVMDLKCRGLVFKPLNQGDNKRALIMPITLSR